MHFLILKFVVAIESFSEICGLKLKEGQLKCTASTFKNRINSTYLRSHEEVILLEDLLLGQHVVVVLVSLEHEVLGLGLAVVVVGRHDPGADLLQVHEAVPVTVPELRKLLPLGGNPFGLWAVGWSKSKKLLF